MSYRISDRDIARVLEHNPIVDVAGERIDLHLADDGTFKGVCPFTGDPTETFYVTPERGMWFCFGCDTGGDAITLLERLDGITYTDAVLQLADRAGVKVDLEPKPSAVRAARALRQGIPAAIEQRDLKALISNLAGWLGTDLGIRQAVRDEDGSGAA